MKTKYKSEIEAMRDFYDELGELGEFHNESGKLCEFPDYSCNTDGRVEGTLVEIKLTERGLPKEQLERYIKAYNAVALPIPRYSLFININKREFTFVKNIKSKRDDIDLKTDNIDWKIEFETIHEGSWEQPKDLLKYLEKKDYMNGWITEYSIVAYNDKFYRNHLSTDKEDFIKEIANPKELIIEPYHWDKTGDMERSILDCLGSIELKKRLGAFFTPDEYVKISTKYLKNAIERVPEGHDYIILDRCAGTGNLEKYLTTDELSHCILNTYVYSEWTTLKGLYSDRVRYIIPHNKDFKDVDGLLLDGDALTEGCNKIIKDIIAKERKKANGKLIVIGLENPPYSTPGAEATRSGKTYKQTSWAKEQMRRAKIIKGDAGSDLCNHFIYSAINILNINEYIVFAPIKYWKSQHLFDGKFNEGYLCNREFFHATKASISLISWINTKKCNNDQLIFQSDIKDVVIKKIYNGASTLLPNAQNRRANNSFAGIILRNGTPINLNGHLVNKITKHDEGRVRELNSSNTMQLLPLFVANCYKPKDYTEKEVIMKSGDGGLEYQKDKDFLDDCFVWSCLTNANKCMSNEQIKNELCLGQDTKADKLLDINSRHIELLKKWREVLKLAKNTDEYKPEWTYGLQQIIKDINIKEDSGDCNKKGVPIMVHKYDELNESIKELKTELNKFYEKYITDNLFKYELLK